MIKLLRCGSHYFAFVNLKCRLNKLSAVAPQSILWELAERCVAIKTGKSARCSRLGALADHPVLVFYKDACTVSQLRPLSTAEWLVFLKLIGLITNRGRWVVRFHKLLVTKDCLLTSTALVLLWSIEVSLGLTVIHWEGSLRFNNTLYWLTAFLVVHILIIFVHPW